MDPQSQGGIEDGEEPKNAAIRELREETGIESAEIIAEVSLEIWQKPHNHHCKNTEFVKLQCIMK